VETGQTLLGALRRELMEEARIELCEEPPLHGVFLNAHVSPRDHVAIYIVRAFTQDRLPEPNREIAECGFFGLNALPVDTTEGTRRRLAEVLHGVPRSATWR
jgi:ADP-ribose pyrophosphatase YjhB (NUDIX family)